MNEFIVWDKKSKKFRCPKVFVFDTNSRHDINKEHKLNLVQCWGEPFYGYMDEESNPDVWIKREGKEYNVFPYIGKKDINNKKIYADCSIIEFEYYFEDRGWETLKAYFFYCRANLCYFLHEIGNSKCNSKISYSIGKVMNIKIIDTIQENKLGFIKE